MEVSNRRRRVTNGVAAGSVWESRMKLDEFKVFKSEENSDENNNIPLITTIQETELQKQSLSGMVVSVKRKTWKSDRNEVNPIQIARKISQSPKKGIDETDLIKKTRSDADGNEKKAKIDAKKDLEMADQGIEKIPIGIKRVKSDENCKEFGVCEEKVITSNFSDKDRVKSDSKSGLVNDDHRNDDDDDDDDNGVEIEKKSVVAEQKLKKVVVIEEKKDQHINGKQVVNNVKIHPTPTKIQSNSVSEEFHRKHKKLQSLVDLVMWKDVTKSAFIFGIGTFMIISSSFTQDFNISLISVLSYLGLVYLAAIFLFRSLISRGASNTNVTIQDHVVGEEEAMWWLKLILPYINEFFLNLKSLFSGDPTNTMKMAVLLFILARCGSHITVWKMAKLGFFGIFIVPKICSSYSTQITTYGTFWIQRFGDAWGSCSHKKTVAFGVFALVWNLSSIIARIWAAFMLFAAFKYYQQSLMRRECGGDEAISVEDTLQGQQETQRKERTSSILTEARKPRKLF